MERRLYRSRKNTIIAGVAGGLGEYFDIDPVFVRVIFVVATLAGASGLLAYIILWIVVPKEKFVFQTSTQTAEGESNVEQKNTDYEYRYRRRHGGVIGGIVLVVLGALFLADNYLPFFSFSNTWPLILVAIGVGLIMNSVRREEQKGEHHESQ
ncbi:MAG: PspC domain-containing protein [Candidatus Kryptoniota bacterium]